MLFGVEPWANYLIIRLPLSASFQLTQCFSHAFHLQLILLHRPQSQWITSFTPSPSIPLPVRTYLSLFGVLSPIHGLWQLPPSCSTTFLVGFSFNQAVVLPAAEAHNQKHHKHNHATRGSWPSSGAGDVGYVPIHMIVVIVM